MKVKVLAVEDKSFNKDGKEVNFYRVCVQTEEGRIGFIGCGKCPDVGSYPNLTLVTDKENNFRVRLAL